MKRVFLLALATIVAACDGTSRPEPVGSVNIVRGTVAVDEYTLQVGDTVQLSANVRDTGGDPLTGREVQWSSSLESVATVSSTGLVTAISPGETIVKATAEGLSDEVLIIVRAPPPSALLCEEGDAGLSLAVGQVHTTSAASSPILCLAGGASGSEYVLVPFNAAEASQNLSVEVAGSGLIPAIGPPNPTRLAEIATAAGLSVPTLREDTRFHGRLRARERQQLAHLARGGGGPTPLLSRSSSASGSGISAAVQSVGDLVRYNVNSQSACENPTYRHARVMAVSQRAVVVADTLNPSGGFTMADYEHFAATFDTLVYPTITGNFGTPRDVDNNGGRTVILYTGAVNELTPENSGSFVGGFFFSRDLFPTVANDSMGACAASNEAEMFYMLVPDPNGEINNNKRSKEFVAERTIGTIAHEFQHLINASRRLFIIKAGGSAWVEQTWLNEGLSHIAEELIFYAATPLEPEQNIDIEDLRADPAVFDRWIRYSWSNFARFASYLQTPRAQSLMGIPSDDDLETRGATWAFLRYMADRRDGTEPALWQSLVDTERTGLDNLNAALNGEALAWMRDWTVSVYADDAVPTSPIYQMPSWNFRNIYTELKSASTGTPLYTSYPLEVLPLLDGEGNQRTMTLQGGGAAFLKFGIGAGQRAALRALSGGAPAPARLMISIIRTK